MSFLRLHKLCSYLLAATGLFAILLPGELHPITWPISLIAVAVSWAYDPPRNLDETYRMRWTVVTAGGVLMGLAVGIMGIFPNPILLGAYLIILLQINKLFNRRENKDYLHLYILSFLMLTLGTILNTGIGFAVCFLLYVIFITWTLTLFHLRREIEETYLMRHSEELSEGEKVDISQILQSRRLVRGGFLASISMIALAIFVMSSTLFFLFPRLGFGLFFQRKRQGVAKSGFSNEMRLGNFGRIQLNRKVILRVELPKYKGKKPKRLLHYWRGLSYDLYDGRSWKRSRRFFRNATFTLPDRYRISSIPRAQRSKILEQIIYQEPLDVPVLFGVDRVFQVRMSMTTAERLRRRPPGVRVDVLSDSLSFRRYARESALRYTVLSVPQVRRPLNARARRALARVQALYLQLPKNLNPKIKTLTQEVTKGARTNLEKARKVEEFLSKQFKYSLERKAFSGPPLDDFLFKQRVGHCEYFSTALAVMLRTIGIPTRQVTGFYSASWNKYGQFYAVRQSDAHAWTEVLLSPSLGWQRFDASPRAAPSSLDNLWRTAEAYVDALRLRWYKWIIEYDLVHQINALKALRKRFKSSSPSMSMSVSKKTKQQMKRTGLGIVAVLAVALLLFGLWWRRRKVSKEKGLTYSAVSQLYLTAVTMLEEYDIRRDPAETPEEFVRRLSGLKPGLAAPMDTLTEVYLQLRYNPMAGASYHFSQLVEALGTLRQEAQALRDAEAK